MLEREQKLNTFKAKIDAFRNEINNAQHAEHSNSLEEKKNGCDDSVETLLSGVKNGALTEPGSCAF